MVAGLSNALKGDDTEEVRQAFRGLIGHVDFKPLTGLGKFDLEVYDTLAFLLGVSERVANCEVMVGAGTRTHFKLRLQSGQDAVLAKLVLSSTLGLFSAAA